MQTHALHLDSTSPALLPKHSEHILQIARWLVLAAILVLTLLPTSLNMSGVPDWALLLCFGGYLLLADWQAQRLKPHVKRAWLDLGVALFVYVLSSDPAGPLFDLVLLNLVYLAFRTDLARSLFCTFVCVGVVTIDALNFPLWLADSANMRMLAGRLLVLALVGVGTGLLTGWLRAEQAEARALANEATKLRETERLYASFVTSVSHDLKTPFTAVRAGIGMLGTSSHLTGEERTLLANTERNIQRLGMLIEDLLTFNQLEAGVLQIEREPVDLRGAIMDAVATVHPLMRQKEQSLCMELPEPLLLEGSARRLEQAVVNLLANAHVHTPSGTRILVQGHCIGSEIQLAVQDTGPGIPAQELENIFKRFHRIGVQDQGMGLGLANARAIIELHAGRIWAESKPGSGTCFQIRLPLLSREGD